MAVPFGFSVGDFRFVGKLIGTVAAELRENGDAAPEYQDLLLELEALNRGLQQLLTLRPAENELHQLDAIRAAALICRRPLEDFLAKLSRFEDRLGTWAVRDNRLKGLPRRMQWRLLFKDDIKQLRSILGGQVAMINLLLSTQTVDSMRLANADRMASANALQERVAQIQKSIEGVNATGNQLLGQSSELQPLLERSITTSDAVSERVDEMHAELQDQKTVITDLHSMIIHTQQYSKSILGVCTHILGAVTSGLMSLRNISAQVQKLFELCKAFTDEMRVAMSEILNLFRSLHLALTRLQSAMPDCINLPIVRFTDAWGETMALPYQMCQSPETFKQLLSVLCTDKYLRENSTLGCYVIWMFRGRRLIPSTAWSHIVTQNDHLSMWLVYSLGRYFSLGRYCPYSHEGIRYWDSFDGHQGYGPLLVPVWDPLAVTHYTHRRQFSMQFSFTRAASPNLG